MPIDRPSKWGYVLLPLAAPHRPPRGAGPLTALHTVGAGKAKPSPGAVEATTSLGWPIGKVAVSVRVVGSRRQSVSGDSDVGLRADDGAPPSGGDLALYLGHADTAGGRQPPRARRAIGAGDGRNVVVVAAHRHGDVSEVRRSVVCRVPCEDLHHFAGCWQEHFDPRVRAAFPDEMAGHIAGGDAEQPAKREHHTGVVLADALSLGECLACRGVHAGPVKAIP